jgi:hypothetical protein
LLLYKSTELLKLARTSGHNSLPIHHMIQLQLIQYEL